MRISPMMTKAACHYCVLSVYHLNTNKGFQLKYFLSCDAIIYQHLGKYKATNNIKVLDTKKWNMKPIIKLKRFCKNI